MIARWLLDETSARTRGVVLNGIALILTVYNIIINAVRAAELSSDEGAPFYDNPHTWIAVVTFSVAVTHIRFIFSLQKAAWSLAATPTTVKTTLWAQAWFATIIAGYAYGTDSMNVTFLIITFPVTGVFFGVPRQLITAFSVMSVVVIFLLDLGRYAPDLGVDRYHTEPAPFGNTFAVWACLGVVYLAALSFDDRLLVSESAVESQSAFARQLLGAIAKFNIDAANGTAVSYSQSATADRDLVDAAMACINAMEKHRPYLPAAVIAAKADEFGDDDDEDVRLESDDDADDLGREVDEDYQNVYRAGRSGGHGGLGGDHDGAHGATTTTFLRERSCTVLFIECIDVIDAPSALDITKRAEAFATVVVEQITRNDGTVDHMTPFTFLASFNGQTPCPRHAKRACSAALGILNRCHQDFPEFSPTMGIDTRSNLCGVCGVDRLRARVVCGDGVELVKSLPSLSRFHHAPIILSQSTHSDVVSGNFNTVPIDVVHTNGMLDDAEDMVLYELRPRRLTQATEAYCDAFHYLRQGNRSEAIRMLGLYERLIGHGRQDHHSVRLSCVIQAMPDDPSVIPAALLRYNLQWSKVPGEDEFERLTIDETDNGTTTQERQERVEEANFEGVLHKLVPDQAQQDAAFVDDEEDGGGLISMFQFGGGSDDDDDAADARTPKHVEETARAADKPAGALALAAAAETPQETVDRLPSHFQDDVLMEKWVLSKYSLGTGSFSSVYLGMSLEGLLVAMKCVNLMAKQTDKVSLSNEVVRMRRLSHHNVVSYISCANIGSQHFIIIMEYVSGGSLKHVLDTFGPPPIPAIRKYVTDLLRGLKYLHDNGMIHCDIKPHNALLTPDGSVKLSDFGSAVNVTRYGQEQGEEELLVRGTSYYLAPEACRNELSSAVDIWSVGVTVLELMTGRLPWDYRGSEANFIRELGKNEEMKPRIPADIPSNAAAFCKMCLQRDPSKRPTAESLLRTPFLSG